MIMSYDSVCVFFFFKQKTAYEMRISDWSSDVCSSDLIEEAIERMRSPKNNGFTASFDMLGEAARTFDDAEHYYAAYREAIQAVGREGEAGHSISVKLSARSEEGRVGKECVRTCRSRWSPYH